MYDYIIIGGGIAGLYANYLLSKNNNGILLEREEYFGGRAYEMDFHGTLIKLGAGIMADHNKHLLSLLKELKIKVNSFKSNTATNFINLKTKEDYDMGDTICKIKNTFEENKKIIKNKGYTMKEFLVKYFGTKFTNEFILNCEYYDFLKSDVEYFIKYYDINDMSHEPYTVLIIKWIDLINKLIKKNCYNNVEVLSVEKNETYNMTFNVKTKDNNNNYNYYQCKKIIFATSLKPLIKLSKNIIDINYSKYIGTVPFIRIYCYYKNGYIDNLSHYTIVDTKLQKIIKINDNVLMASYSDSSNALYWKKIKQQSKEKQINIVSKYLEQLNIKGKINDIVIAFWDEGVHYYKPTKDLNKTIKKLAKPAKNVYVLGEIISYKQGWVEGAIESVNRII
jgi:protoporphyrinogen oxidase